MIFIITTENDYLEMTVEQLGQFLDDLEETALVTIEPILENNEKES